MKKERILIVGDTLADITGLGYVGGSWANLFLQDEETFEAVGYLNISGRNIKDDFSLVAIPDAVRKLSNLEIFRLQNYPIRIEEYDKVIQQFNPSIVFSVHDPWTLEVIAYSKYRSSYYWIAYSTIEVPEYRDRVYGLSQVTGRKYRSIYSILNKADLVIPVTQMGKNALENYVVTRTKEKFNNICEDYIYNGLEIDLREKEKLPKSKVFGYHCDDSKFVFMTVGVNSERKKLHEVLLVFRKFLDSVANPDLFRLYMHTNSNASGGGPDLYEVMHDLNLENMVMTLGKDAYIKKEELYKVYKTSDMYIGFPGGEGFGYGFAESMLHGLPMVYINYGGHAEFARFGGLPAKVERLDYAVKMGMKWGVVDKQDAVDQMFRLYKDKKLYKKLSEEGQQYAIENFDWEKLYMKFKNVLEKYYLTSPYKPLYYIPMETII